MLQNDRENLELDKLQSEIQKLGAERSKLKAEERKLKLEVILYPLVVGGGVITAFVTAAALLLRL